jgi:hypothetical protein
MNNDKVSRVVAHLLRLTCGALVIASGMACCFGQQYTLSDNVCSLDYNGVTSNLSCGASVSRLMYQATMRIYSSAFCFSACSYHSISTSLDVRVGVTRACTNPVTVTMDAGMVTSGVPYVFTRGNAQSQYEYITNLISTKDCNGTASSSGPRQFPEPC